MDDLRYLLAWMLYCHDEGYTTHQDRANADNWIQDNPTTLTEMDLEHRDNLLAMADEIIGELREAGYALVPEGRELPSLRLSPSPDVLP
jgi:hypothetical protein